jgi:hypothetical protein
MKELASFLNHRRRVFEIFTDTKIEDKLLVGLGMA